MSDFSKTINCKSHGEGFATLVCQHLASRIGQGYFFAKKDPNDPYPDAWCAECESILQKENGWTKKALKFAIFKVICNDCYSKAKDLNRVYLVH